jgi:peptidyl-prolyl cis-trans isomerase B (cyclophilin B)
MRRSWRTWFVMTLAIVVLSATTTGCGDEKTSALPSPSASASAAPMPSASSSANGAAANLKPEELTKQFPNSPLLTGKATLQLTIQGQPVTIELNGADAPVSSGNFVDLVEKKFYDGLVFHRVVKEPAPFVVQGGDPKGKDPNVTVDQLGGGGYIDPATNQERLVPLEIKTAEGRSVYGQTFSSVPGLEGKKPLLRHTRGAVAMARSQNPNSGSSQFYITLADQGFLDGEYAVFGYVKEGMNVVDKIKQGDRIDSLRVLNMDPGAFIPVKGSEAPKEKK